LKNSVAEMAASELPCRPGWSRWRFQLTKSGGCRFSLWNCDQFGEFSEILDSRGHKKFISGARRPSKTQTIEAQDTFEMGEQHLDLLSLSS